MDSCAKLQDPPLKKTLSCLKYPDEHQIMFDNVWQILTICEELQNNCSGLFSNFPLVLNTESIKS